jgi:ABC-type transport system involved in multi-copper enzyme maturation permease subunit
MRRSLDLIGAIALLTIREASRRRVLVALALLTLAVIVLTGWGFAQLERFAPPGVITEDEAYEFVIAQLLILVLFMFSFVFALAAVFLAAPSIAGDLDSGLALAMMARPIRRAELLLGRWLGLAVVIGAYVLVAVGLQLVVTHLVTGYGPPAPLAVLGYLVAQPLLLLCLSVLLSARLSTVTSGICGLLLFALGWVSGIVAGIGRAFGDDMVARVNGLVAVALPTDGLWRGAIHALEPPDVLVAMRLAGRTAAAFPFYAPEPPPFAFLLWCVAWAVGALVLAALVFERREV